jgi:hypothetical protein
MIQVLEIGGSNSPAIAYPGNLLVDPRVVYHAVDCDETRLFEGIRLQHESFRGTIGRIVVGDSAMLDWPDGCLNYAASRSVFGEYTMPPDRTGSSIDNTHAGIMELFRTLRVGGEVFIAEENTPEAPATPYAIGVSLLSAGFHEVTVYPCQNMENEHWLAERTKIWGLQSVSVASQPIDKNGVT